MAISACSTRTWQVSSLASTKLGFWGRGICSSTSFVRTWMLVTKRSFRSIQENPTINPGDLIKGRTFRRLNVTRKIVIKDVPSLIKTALDMQTFALGHRCVRQRRGSRMGSPLFAALCLMVVSISEQILSMDFKESLTNHNLFICHIRYVDNRLIFGDKRLQQLHPYEVLLGEGFYGRPIVLETEPDQEFLGFMLETPPLTPSSTSSAPAPSPTIPAAAASSSSPDPTGPATYASDLSAQDAPPFPPAETSWEHRRPQTFFTEQTVHQVFFEVFTFDNDRRELWINEIDFRGYSRLREPEQYFYSLTGDDAYARHTSDYRRVFFNIPTHSTSTTLIIMDITTKTFIQLQQPHLQLHHQHRQPPLRPILQHRQHNSKNVSLHHLLRDPTQLR